ncbi:hypothetical protein M404DRAFT_1006656 [Pisolithus tinctorius Marx 270]|uniref:Uncharacterized protein n=1 Tax=Pisolithus tinctorius Marx 270 TaxID=870435 RepID=A0A0C3N6E1_PISTI|nr:hypothetical protein M404DRAFT_1006656 [Pisolithus tinctorius Marx 270]
MANSEVSAGSIWGPGFIGKCCRSTKPVLILQRSSCRNDSRFSFVWCDRLPVLILHLNVPE